MNPRASILILPALLLGGCDPERGSGSDPDLSSAVDLKCVDRVLRTVFAEVERRDYVSNGGKFPDGARVTQFVYSGSPGKSEQATLEFGSTETGTRISQSPASAGDRSPQAAPQPALEAKKRAGEAVLACNIDLSDIELRETG